MGLFADLLKIHTERQQLAARSLEAEESLRNDATERAHAKAPIPKPKTAEEERLSRGGLPYSMEAAVEGEFTKARLYSESQSRQAIRAGWDRQRDDENAQHESDRDLFAFYLKETNGD